MITATVPTTPPITPDCTFLIFLSSSRSRTRFSVSSRVSTIPFLLVVGETVGDRELIVVPDLRFNLLFNCQKAN